MNELFRNLGLSSSSSSTLATVATSSTTTTTSGNENCLVNPFVGDIVDVGNFHLRLELLIAEGYFFLYSILQY
mgnify:FL=1